MPETSQPEISFSSASQHKNASSTYFCRLANLLADEFPLVLVVFLDRCEQLCTLPLSVSFRLTGVASEGPKTSKNSHRPLQTRRSAYPVAAVVSRGAVRNERPICAYLVPMFLYAPLCPLRKCLKSWIPNQPPQSHRGHISLEQCAHPRVHSWIWEYLPLRFRSSYCQHPSSP
jgi:hypothetical protein